MILIFLSLLVSDMTPEELAQQIAKTESRMTQVEIFSDTIPSVTLTPHLALILREIETIRHQAIRLRRGGFYAKWESLENRLIKYLDEIHMPSRRDLYGIAVSSMISPESWSRLQRWLPELPPHPEAVAKFQQSSEDVLRLEISEMMNKERRAEILKTYGGLIWISVPSLDFLDSEHATTAEKHFVYGFNAEDPPPELANLGEIEIWEMSYINTHLLYRADENMIREAYRKKPENIRRFAGTLQREHKINVFAPGSHIVSMPKKGPIQVARWESPLDIDELLRTDIELPPTVWFAFLNAPRDHFELVSVLDPLPSLRERGRFSIFERVTETPLYNATPKDYFAVEPQLSRVSRPRVVDLLHVVYTSAPDKFSTCGAFLRKFKLLR